MIEPGLHLALSRDGYEQIDAPNISRLKHLRRSPAHARHALLHPEPPTQAQELGQAVHLAVLERDRWEHEYIAAPPCDRRTKEGKAIWADLEARAEGRTILREAEYELCADLAAAVWSHPVAAEILRGKGVNEASLIWREGEGMAKCRLDSLRMIAGRACAGGRRRCLTLEMLGGWICSYPSRERARCRPGSIIASPLRRPPIVDRKSGV